jgi:hypothetical protein
LVCILVSGFRNMFLQALVAIVLAAWLYRGWRELGLAAVLGTILIAGLIAGQGRFYELPVVAQRTLSFLPGKWSEVAVENALESTTSRLMWWKIIVSEGLIRNWWVGDGFGVSQRDFETMGQANTFEGMLLTGTYHNGPLTTIRYAGLVGLVLFYALMIATAIYSYRCARQLAGTALYPLALFVAVQTIWLPFQYTLVFGSFEINFPEQVFLVGLLQLAIRLGNQRPVAVPPATIAQSALAVSPA